MSTRLQRFDFGSLRDFRGPMPLATSAEDIRIELPEAPPPPPPTFSETEMEAIRINARHEGYSEGFAAGMAQAQADADASAQRATASIHQLAEQLTQLETTYAELLHKESAELSELVLMIARKVAGEALNARSADTIAAMVTQCLPILFSRPRLIIDLHPDALEQVMARIEPLLQQHGYEGEVQFRSNANLGVHDAMLDWGVGQARRSSEMLWQEIEDTLQRLPLELSLPHTLTAESTPATGEEHGR